MKAVSACSLVVLLLWAVLWREDFSDVSMLVLEDGK